MHSIDYTNYRYGRSTLSLADADINKKLKIRKQFSSKIDTADFYRLPTIRTIWFVQFLKCYLKNYSIDLDSHVLKAK